MKCYQVEQVMYNRGGSILKSPIYLSLDKAEWFKAEHDKEVSDVFKRGLTTDALREELRNMLSAWNHDTIICPAEIRELDCE